MKKDQDNYLIHYGVLGMKWGVRKAVKLRKKNSKASRQADAYLNVAGRTETERSKRPRTASKNWKVAAKQAIKKDVTGKKFVNQSKKLVKMVNKETNPKKLHKYKSIIESGAKKINQISKDDHNVIKGLKEIQKLEASKLLLSSITTGPIGVSIYGLYSGSASRYSTAKQIRRELIKK